MSKNNRQSRVFMYNYVPFSKTLGAEKLGIRGIDQFNHPCNYLCPCPFPMQTFRLRIYKSLLLSICLFGVVVEFVAVFFSSTQTAPLSSISDFGALVPIINPRRRLPTTGPPSPPHLERSITCAGHWMSTMLHGGLRLKGISFYLSKFRTKDFDCDSGNDGLPCDVTSRLVL